MVGLAIISCEAIMHRCLLTELFFGNPVRKVVVPLRAFRVVLVKAAESKRPAISP